MPGGRPSKLNADTKTALLQGIELGLTYKDAALAADITYTTFRNWVQRGEEAKSGEYFEFVESLARAHAIGAQALLMLIRQSANEGDSRSAQWILERRHREDYGPPDPLAGLKEGPDGSDFLRGAEAARKLYREKKDKSERT